MSKKRGFSLIELSIVIVIIGLLIIGVVGSKHLIAKSRLITARAMTNSSPISGTLDNRLWLESSLSEISLGEDLSTGDAITSWGDNSINKTEITISEVGNGATYANTINYIQAVKFGDSSDDDHLQIDNASFLNGTDYTIFILDKRISSNSGGGNYLLGSASSFAVGYSSETTIVQTHGESADDDNQSNIEDLSSYSNKPRLLTFTHSSVDGNKIYINGVLANEDTSSEAKAHLSGITTLAIGNNYNGEIGEIAIFDRDLKTVERRDIENYLTDKWNAPNNRDTSSSCVGGIITSTGCNNSCSVSINGVSETSVDNGTSDIFTCNDSSAYDSSDTISYSCSSGSLSFTSDQYCNCASGYVSLTGSGGECVQGCSVDVIVGSSDSGTNVANGTVVSCDESGFDGSTIATCSSSAITGSCSCASGYNLISGECKSQCTLTSQTGLASDTVVTSGSSSQDCDSGYAGEITYSCDDGTLSSVNNSCVEITCDLDAENITGVTQTGTVSGGSGTLTCDDTNFDGEEIDYTCNSSGEFENVGTCACDTTTKLAFLNGSSCDEISTDMWLDASDSSTITHSSNAVSAWADKSGKGNNLTQSTAGKRPTTNNTSINSLNTLSFDDVNDSLTLGSAFIGSSEDFTFFAVARFANIDGHRFVISQYENGNSSRTTFIILNGSNKNLAFFRAGMFDSGQVLSVNQAYNFYSSRDGSSTTVEVNGVGDTSTSFTNSPSAQVPFTIGTSQDGAGYMNGDIGELIGFKRVLTATQKSNIENYLSTKWGI